jgi:hypothetical protein
MCAKMNGAYFIIDLILGIILLCMTCGSYMVYNTPSERPRIGSKAFHGALTIAFGIMTLVAFYDASKALIQ